MNDTLGKGHGFDENDIFENNENDYIIFFFINSSPWSFKLRFVKALWKNVNQRRKANMFQKRKMIEGPIAFPTWI